MKQIRLLTLLLFFFPLAPLFSLDSIEVDNQSTIEGLYRAFNLKNYKWIESHTSSNCQYIRYNIHSYYPYPSSPLNESIISYKLKNLSQVFPDFVFTVQDICVKENKVMVHSTLTGVAKEPFLDKSPSDKMLHLRFFTIYTLNKGKIERIEEMWNEYSVMQELSNSIDKKALIN